MDFLNLKLDVEIDSEYPYLIIFRFPEKTIVIKGPHKDVEHAKQVVDSAIKAFINDRLETD